MEAKPTSLALRVGEAVAITVLYYGLARIGQLLAIPPGNVTAVWPASGFALAAVLLRGNRVWLGIFLGAFFGNTWAFFDSSNTAVLLRSITTGVGIGVGSAVQAVAGAALIRRLIGTTIPFGSTRDAIRFAGLVVLSCTVSPSFGVTSLCLGGFTEWGAYAFTWRTWWIGDAVGMLVVAPTFLTWRTVSLSFSRRSQIAESFGFVLLVTTSTLFVFHGNAASGAHYSQPYMLLPFIVWAAFRFGPSGVALSSLLVSSVAVWATVKGAGPFVREALNESLLLVQSFVGVGTVTGLVLAGAVAERTRAEEALSESEERLRLALKAADAGVWDWGMLTGQVRWSDNVAALFGLTPGSFTGAFADYLSCIHPEDRDLVTRSIKDAVEGRIVYDIEHRVLWPDGSVHWLSCKGDVFRDQAGQAVRMIGTVASITARKKAEDELAQRQIEQQVLLDLIPAMVWYKDAQNRILRVNRAAAASLNKSPAELEGQPTSKFYPEEAEKYYQDDLEVIASGRPKLGIIEPLQTASGKKRWVRTDKVPYRDETGTIVGVLVFAEDITARKQTEEALRESEERYRILVESAPVGIHEIDMDGRLVSMNQTGLRMMGAKQETQIRGLAYLDVVAPEDRARIGALLARACAGEALEFEFSAITDHSALYFASSFVPVKGADGSVFKLMGVTQDITARKQAEATAQSSLSTLNSLIQNLQSGVLFEDTGRKIIFVSHPFCTMFSIPAPQVLVGVDCREAAQQAKGLFADPEQFVQCIEETVGHAEPVTGRELALRDGRTVEQDYVPVFTDNVLSGHLWIYSDITERRHLEEQLRQSQKMEAVGRLAGGIAHDFNNLLTVIIGYCHLLLNRENLTNTQRNSALQIGQAGERASLLTSQLLAFSRRQVLQPKVLNLNEVVATIAPMLRRLLGEDIEVVSLLMPNLGQVQVDPGQMDQVIMNLAVNARDAMSEGGTLTIETVNVELDEAAARPYPFAQPGPYVTLAVTDTGCGMDRETQACIFEPFFTTKSPGKGTGLGLSTVFGIVKQSGGFIMVDSEPRRGARFTIYLPRVAQGTPPAESGSPLAQSAVGSETILLVEDEKMVRELNRKVLQEKGYKVLEAMEGRAAMQLCQSYEGPIHLLVTDVVMPGMSGWELGKRVGSRRPDMKVLYISGYTDDTIGHHRVLDAGVAFLPKPFMPDALARKVREVLDAPPGGSS